MFILKELIADSSYFRKYFIYIDEIIDMSKCKIYANKIMSHHIIIINHVFFGINRRNFIDNKKKWIKISQVLIEFINSIDNKICILIGDCHEYSFIGGIRSVAIACKKFNVDYIVSLYDENDEIKKLKRVLTNIKSRTTFIPINNMIKGWIFKDYRLPKIFDIVLYGTVNKKYPLRQKLYHLLKSKKFNNVFKIKVIDYGEYREEELSKILNQSYLCVATNSQFDYLVKKYFEISASNSLILGNIPTQGVDIFKDNYIHISDDMPGNDIFKTIKDALLKTKKIKEKSQRNHDIIHKYHTIDKFHKLLYFKITEHALNNCLLNKMDDVHIQLNIYNAIKCL